MKADLGPKKGVFYRLRVGPLANANARVLCKKALEAEIGLPCCKAGTLIFQT